MWYNKSTLRIAADKIGADKTDNSSLCLNIQWETRSFDPVLEDCIDLSLEYGHWYGGHINRDTLSFGSQIIDHTSYLPGKTFGLMAERFWMSTNGIALVAGHDFPLHIRVDAQRKLCLSSWYGYQTGKRKLSYSICRASNHQAVRALVLDRFYNANVEKYIQDTLFYNPLYSISSSFKQKKQELQKNNITYSYILDSSISYSMLADDTFTAPSNGCGVKLTPYAPLSDHLNLTSHGWLTSTDMDIPRLFKLNNKPHLLLNSSVANLTTILDATPKMNVLVFVTDLSIGDIGGQENYVISETVDTFQPYISNTLALISNSSFGPVMSTVVSANQKSPIIVYLQPSNGDLSNIIQQVVHSSLMGYNIINAGEITASSTTDHLIRTLQLAIFLPIIQLSNTARKHIDSNYQLGKAWNTYLDTRIELGINEIIMQYTAEGKNDYPLYAPIWWRDITAKHFDVVDQFLFNDRYLVIPIVNTSSTIRTFYLPPGHWLRVQIPVTKAYVGGRKLYVGDRTVEISIPVDQMLVFEHGEY